MQQWHGEKRKSSEKVRPGDIAEKGDYCQQKESHNATVAWRKGNLTRNIRIQESCESSKDFAADRMRKVLGRENGLRHRDIKESPHLRIERKTASSSGGQHKREQ
jgi:hypothetical protein